MVISYAHRIQLIAWTFMLMQMAPAQETWYVTTNGADDVQDRLPSH